MSYDDIYFQMDFDFIDPVLLIQTNKGSTKTIVLRPRSVSDFYHHTAKNLYRLIDARLHCKYRIFRTIWHRESHNWNCKNKPEITKSGIN